MATEHLEPINSPRSILESKFSAYPDIDWNLLAQASNYYLNNGYKKAETPWLIPAIYSSYTKPHCDKSFIQSEGMFTNQAHELVGSAEQGFIYLLLNNLIKDGKYSSITPCFRSEIEYDRLHYPWFMKLELFIKPKNKNIYEKELSELIDCAFSFFQTHSQGQLEIIQLQDNTFDINLNGIEIGSYGTRRVEHELFIYGTGLALPRFSLAK